jgi:F0F1-type ATP synthase assembly protein I
MASEEDGSWGRNLGFGLQIGVGVTLGYLIGAWCDRKFGSAPWGLVIGVSLGLASGMYLLIKDGIRMNKD